MFRRLKIPIPPWMAGCSTPTNPGPGIRFHAELGKEFGKEIENGFEIKFGKNLGHGSKIEKSSVAFGFKINKYTFYNPLPAEKTDQRAVDLREGVMP